jgi:hypothetical protein
MNESTSALLADAHDIVREQLALAWRRHMERVQEVLESQWPAQMERTLEETVAGLAARLEEQYQDAFEGRLEEQLDSARAARRELIQKLNQAARRLRHFENEAQWAKTLVDATRGFCDRAVLFQLGGRALRVLAARNVDGDAPVNALPIDAAHAFATAVETRDTLVAMRTPGEMSEPIAAYLGAVDGGKFYLIPITTRQGVAALLYADAAGSNLDADALELLAGMAGAVRDSRPALPEPTCELVSITGAPQKPGIPSWFSLSPEDRELHLKAQRFARVQVAGIRLYKSEIVKNGRTARNLYTSLKEEIDGARAGFRRDCLNASESMVDYLHLEIVRTLANDDVELLGPDYPGPMG